jgi:hypothetical protein
LLLRAARTQRCAGELARATGVGQKARTFSPWSHIVALLYAQLTHAIGLNDVCDALRLHSGPLSALRGATAPTRNNLPYANKHRVAVATKGVAQGLNVVDLLDLVQDENVGIDFCGEVVEFQVGDGAIKEADIPSGGHDLIGSCARVE